MNIGARLTAAFSSVLFIIGAGAIITNWQFAVVGSDARRIIEIDNRLTSVQQVERDIGDVSRHIAGLVEQQREARLLVETQAVRKVLEKHLGAAMVAFGRTGPINERRWPLPLAASMTSWRRLIALRKSAIGRRSGCASTCNSSKLCATSAMSCTRSPMQYS